MVYRILVASYTNSITTLIFDPSKPSLSVTSSIEVGFHPSWITPHPDDASIVFTGLEDTVGKIVALKYDEDGKGTILGEIESGGDSPASLLVVDGALLVGNYMSGNLLQVPLSSKPPYLPAFTACKSVSFTGTGPDKDRQESSHPHQVVFVPELGEVLIPDLGSDKTWRLKRNEEGIWTVVGHVDYEPGSGPRHLVYSDGILYTLLELTSHVATHLLPPLPASPTLLSSTPTMFNPPANLGPMLAAEIFLSAPTPSFPTPYLYVSNRNDSSPLGDSIAIYNLENPREPKLVSEPRTGLAHLRGMVLGGKGEGEEGKWIVAGGVTEGGVKVFERVEGGKGLREVAKCEVEKPTGFHWL